MARKIDVEIAIGGVGLLWVTEPDGDRPATGLWRPAMASNLLVLFPGHPAKGDGEVRKSERSELASEGDGHAHDHGHRTHDVTTHQPTLSFFAGDNLMLPVDSELVSSPDGREVVNVKLANRRVFFEPPYPYLRDNPKSTLVWTAGSGESTWGPASPTDDPCLDWLLDADDIGLVDPRPEGATSIVHLPEGTVSSRYLFRNRQSPNGEPVRWQVGTRQQAVAPQVLLRMKGLWQGLRILTAPLTLDAAHDRESVDEVIELLADRDDLLRISLSNLPKKYDGADSHLRLLSGLSDGGKIVEPVKVDHVFTIGSACDVGRKIGAFPSGAVGSSLRLSSNQAQLTTQTVMPDYFDAIGATAAWDSGKKGHSDVRVAVVDSGIDTREGSRDFLQHRVKFARDLTGSGGRNYFDEIGHGTMMASILAAKYVPVRRIRGIAPEVELMNLKVVDSSGELADETALIEALQVLRDHPAHVALFAIRHSDLKTEGGVSKRLLDAVDAVGNVLIVVAAGELLDPPPDPAIADREHVLVVGRIDDHEEAFLSNGDRDSVHLAAPGSGVFAASIYSGDRISGSSPAAAFVAGAAALAFSEDPTATAASVKQRILDSTREVPALEDKVSSGGMLDIAQLLGLGRTQPVVTRSRTSTQ